MRALLIAAAMLALAACKEEAAQDVAPMALTSDSVGHYCQMNLMEHEGPKAQAHLDGLPGAPLFFSQVRDVIAYLRMPEQSHAVLAIWVNDMGAPGATWDAPGTTNWIDARSAWFVVGGRAVGGMGGAGPRRARHRRRADRAVAHPGGPPVSRDTISLRGITGWGRHGVLASEKELAQPFTVDVDLNVDLAAAGEHDDLAASVSYADVAADAAAVIAGDSVDLVETLAARVAEACLARELVEAVRVTVHKPHAPVGVPFEGVSVTVRRERSVPVVIALGANLGRPERTLAHAVAALRPRGLEATLAELARRLGCWVGLFDSSGTIAQEHPASLAGGADAVADAVAELLGRGTTATRSLEEGERTVTLYTLGRSSQLKGVIAVDLRPIDAEARAAKATAIAAHRTQVAPLSPHPADRAILTPAMVARFAEDEWIVVAPEAAPTRFDERYADEGDPWATRTSWYERRKRAVVLAALRDERYRLAVEVGCGTATLTAELARRCDAALGVDASLPALAEARRTLAGLPNAWVEHRTIDDGLPAADVDLVVVSELGSYVDPDALRHLLEQARVRGAHVALCHWRGEGEDLRTSAADVHALARATPGLRAAVSIVDEAFLVDVLVPA